MNSILNISNHKELNKDKDFFSAYLNMARHNAYIVLSAITEQIGKSPSDNSSLSEMYAIKVLTEKNKPDIALKVIEKLDKHFPFLRPMFDNDTKLDIREEKKGNPKMRGIDIAHDYYFTLSTILNQLDVFRNYYTYPIHEHISIDKKLKFYLTSIYDAAIRVVKERFILDENKDLDHLRRFKGKDKNPDFNYEFFKNDDEITEKGLAFFTCLFLEKKYAIMFLKKLKGFKVDYTPDKLATLETFSVYRIRIPRLRIISGDSKLSLALDMLNDLKRCPKSLFQLLSKDDQKKFRVKKEDNESEYEKDEVYEEEILLTRFSDRFPFFALHYFDQMEIFQQLRFHVDLGHYYYKFYDKITVDGEQRERSLKIHLKAFGRLHELKKQRIGKCGDLIMRVSEREENDTRPYFSDTYPHYHINNNQVGIKFCENGEALFPELQGKETRTEAPDFWLSNYEIPGMVFYALLNKTEGINAAEKLILDYKKNFFLLLNHIMEGEINKNRNKYELTQHISDTYKIDFHDLPDQLKEYLLGYVESDMENHEFVEYAEKKLEDLIAETEQREKRIKNDLKWIRGKSNKVGKEGWVEIKSGKLSGFLAKDMLRMQESNDLDEKGNKTGKDKVTGLNFQILQAHLAFYGRDKHLLNHIFEQCHLIKSDNPHPFLHKLDACEYNDVVRFYCAYLRERRHYFKICLRDKNYKQYYFLKADRNKWRTKNQEYFKNLIKDYSEKPINLPRGLFKDALVKWFSQNGSNKMKEVIANSERLNTIYLLQKYFELECSNDRNQEFYSFKRSYEFINKLFDTRDNRTKFKSLQKLFFNRVEMVNKIDEIKDEISKLPEINNGGDHIKAKIKNEFTQFAKNEKKLRHTQATDMLLFLLAKDILFSQNADNIHEQNFKLSDVKPDSTNDILSSRIPISLSVEYYTSKKEGLGTKIIEQKELKIKNYGDFRHFSNDRRLNELFQWIDRDVIQRADLEKELENYDKARLEAAYHIHHFEKEVCNKLIQYRESFSNEDVLETFYNEFSYFEADKIMVKSIRNAFFHNQYPGKENFSEYLSFDIPNIALSLVEILKEKTNKYICDLQMLKQTTC